MNSKARWIFAASVAAVVPDFSMGEKYQVVSYLIKADLRFIDTSSIQP